MVDFGRLAGKASELLNNPKTQDALKSEKAEKVSDTVLEKGGALASKLTGGTYDQKIEEIKANADKRIGNE
ncbi:antitoxin [Microbacteriaceae bacterium VKM Ac-2855]|nr:antitoxin [Microbacteriaceae bacterium VKM Ac-2855]